MESLRLAVLGPLAALLVALVPAPPAAADLTDLPRGADARVTWLGGQYVHTAKGRTFGLPIPADQASATRLLGRARHSWVVAVLGDSMVTSTSVRRIHRGRYRTVLTVESYYGRPTYQLARHGERLVTLDFDRGGATATAYDLDGRVLGERSWETFGSILDVVGEDAYVAGPGLRLWRPGRSWVRYADSSALVDVARDVLFVRVRGAGVGPTSLAQPGSPSWTTKEFAPRAVSPDGRWVAGYAADSVTRQRRELEVRSMADGSLQPSTGLLVEPNAALGWEDGDHLLVGLRSRLGNALGRCGLDGRCERASDWLPGQAVSLPHQTEYFLDWS